MCDTLNKTDDSMSSVSTLPPLGWWQHVRLKVYKALFFRTIPSDTRKMVTDFTALRMPKESSSIFEGFFVALVRFGVSDSKLENIPVATPHLTNAFHSCCEELHSLMWRFLRTRSIDSGAFVSTVVTMRQLLSQTIQQCDCDTRTAIEKSMAEAFRHLSNSSSVDSWIVYDGNAAVLQRLFMSLGEFLKN